MTFTTIQAVYLIVPALCFGCAAKPTIVTATTVALVAKFAVLPICYQEARTGSEIYERVVFLLVIFTLVTLKWIFLRSLTHLQGKL